MRANVGKRGFSRLCRPPRGAQMSTIPSDPTRGTRTYGRRVFDGVAFESFSLSWDSGLNWFDGRIAKCPRFAARGISPS